MIHYKQFMRMLCVPITLLALTWLLGLTAPPAHADSPNDQTILAKNTGQTFQCGESYKDNNDNTLCKTDRAFE